MFALHLVLGLALAAADAPAIEEQQAAAAETPWEVWVGLVGGVRPDSMGGGGAGVAGINRKVGRYFRPELVLGLGGYAAPTQMVTRIRIGTRIEYPREGLVPYLWVAFAHQHETAAAQAAADPIPEVLGLSTAGVSHRTGAEAGVGASYDFPRRAKDRLAGRIGVRATMTQLLGDGPPREAEVLASLGVCF